MFDFHEKRKIRSILYSKITVLFLVLLSGLLSFSVYNRFTVAEDMRVKLETKRAELEELQMRANLLESKVEYLENERGLEEELRSRFDVVKEGEQVIILVDKEEKSQKSTTNTPSTDEATDTEERSFFDLF